MSRTAIRYGHLFLIGGGAAALLVGLGALSADLMVTHGFRTLGERGAATTFLPATRTSSAQAARAVDDGVWLTRADVESPVAFAKQLAIGDRITIAGPSGRQRILEVVDLRALEQPLAKAVAGASPMRLLLVTCRVVGEDASAPVRFIVEGEPSDVPPVVQPAASPKTL